MIIGFRVSRVLGFGARDLGSKVDGHMEQFRR